MGRLSAVFIAFCMMLIAASAGIVTYLSFGFTGMEATVTAIAAMTALVMLNSLTSRQRDRYDVGSQIADLSRGTADIGRQVSELDRRLVAMEGEVAAAMDRTRAATEPLSAEIGELGDLVKELADAVAAHEQMLEKQYVLCASCSTTSTYCFSSICSCAATASASSFTRSPSSPISAESGSVAARVRSIAAATSPSIGDEAAVEFRHLAADVGGAAKDPRSGCRRRSGHVAGL